MSTDDADRPLTRAELRARREAEEAEPAADVPAAPDVPVAPVTRSAVPDPSQNITPAHNQTPGPRRTANPPVEDPASTANPPVEDPAPSAAPERSEGAGGGPGIGTGGSRPGGHDERPIGGGGQDLRQPPRGAEPEPTPDPEPAPNPEPTRDAEPPAWQPHPTPEAVRRRRRFPLIIGSVVGVLVLVVAGFAVISLLQGPRVTGVKIDAQSAIDASGTRLILTASEPLAKVSASQVTVTPSAPFTVDTSGRTLGIRFTVPLDDDTKYTVSVKDAAGTDRQRTGTLQATFQTPKSTIFLLQRDASGDDKIFLTDLGGKNAVPVFQHTKIDDFRATADSLVVVTEKDGNSVLLVMDRHGKNQRELPLPGPGFLSSMQVSERGNLVGYTFTDKGISAAGGRASVLVTQSLTGDAKPSIVTIGDKEPSTAQWAFVPDTSSVLFIDFTGALYVEDRAAAKPAPTALGHAQTIEGISRGTYTAIVSRANDLIELNLADGSEKPLAASSPDFGVPSTIAPFPGGTLRQVATRDATGLPTGQIITRVDDKGKAVKLFSVTGSDAIMQACPSPSGQYSAVVVAPKLVQNPYDQSLLPLPTTLQTHLLDTKTGKELVVLAGFDPSWCAAAPHR
ncbi:hypothetical protein [Microbacterium panaciterrae]|uniref:SbsA Ig-like domain-containing protein n=1 Tax=Microbacterium panaciterrae TaxID=985759 RepID=A0ABP8P3Q5_9MICO